MNLLLSEVTGVSKMTKSVRHKKKVVNKKEEDKMADK
jgi:hypothetical protein